MQDPAPNVMFLVEVVNCNDGIASYCETLATGLHGRGVQIHLVSGAVRSDDKSEYKRQKLAAAVKEWHVIPGLRKLPSLSIFMQLLKLIRKNNITVINVHGLGMLMWGRLLALLTGARCVATYHPSVLGNIEKVQNAPQSTFSPVQVLFFNLFFSPHPHSDVGGIAPASAPLRAVRQEPDRQGLWRRRHGSFPPALGCRAPRCAREIRRWRR